MTTLSRHLCLAGIVCVLGASAVTAASHFGKTKFYDDVSVESYSAVSTTTVAYTTGGIYTNRTYTNSYRVCATNLKGRFPLSSTWTYIWHGATNSSNALVLSWPAKPGAACYIVEKSYNAGLTFTNWYRVSVLHTNWTDTGTNVPSGTAAFTNSHPTVIPTPTVPWGTSTGLTAESAARIAGDQANSNHVASATGAVAITLRSSIASSATQGSNYADQVALTAQGISTNDAYHKGRRTRDLIFSNTAARAVSVQPSDTYTAGRALSVVAGSTTNNLLGDFVTLPEDISSKSVHSIATIGNNAYYACWGGGDGIFVQTNRTGAWKELPGTDARVWSALLNFNGTLLAAESLGDIYSVDLNTGLQTPLSTGTNAYWTGMATDGSSVYAVGGTFGPDGDLWVLSGGSGPAVPYNQRSDWSDISYAPVANKFFVTDSARVFRLDGSSLTLFASPPGGIDMIAIDASDNIYLGTTNLLFCPSGSSTFTPAAVQTEAAFISDGTFAADGALYCVTSGDHIYLALPGGTANLSGGTLYLDAGLGKGTGQSRVVIRTGAKQSSGTTMQPLTDRLTIDEDGTVTSTGPIVLPAPGTAALHAATVGQVAETGTAVRVYCSNAANLTGTVPDASIATNTPSATSGMLLAWNRTGERFWKWVNMLRNSAGAVALDATTAGLLNAWGNVVSNWQWAANQAYAPNGVISSNNPATSRYLQWTASGRTWTLVDRLRISGGTMLDASTSGRINFQGNKITNATWAADQTFPASQLSGNAPYANVTSALARARAPQAVSYVGTNVYTDARLGTLFRISATNDFRLHKPTGCYPGQSMLYWIKQAVGGTNVVTMTSGDFVPPVGASSVILSVTNGYVDQFFGIWDDSIGKVRVGSFMSYRE